MIYFSAETQQKRDVSSSPESLPTVPARLTGAYKCAAEAIQTKSASLRSWDFTISLNSSGFELMPKEKKIGSSACQLYPSQWLRMLPFDFWILKCDSTVAE